MDLEELPEILIPNKTNGMIMWIDLSQPFSGDMPYSSVLPKPEFETLRHVEEDRVNIQYYCVPTHVGTHVDAPKHFIEGGESIDEIPLDRWMGEGVILDVSKEEPEEITVADVEVAEGDVRADDMVLLYTGWEEKWGTDEYEPHPWLSTDLAGWFVDRGIKFLGVDNITPDIPGSHRPDEYIEYPVHRELLGNDVLIGEHLRNLAPHTGERLEIQALPVKIHGGDGAPARIVAKKII